MNAYLLAWNPRNFEWADLQADIKTLRDTRHLEGRWSCGNARRIPEGSRFFLIRLGLQPKGLIGSGTIISTPFRARHWQDPTRKAFYVGLHFDHLQETPAVPLDELTRPPFSPFRWAIQGSGVQIPEHLVAPLQLLWAQRTGGDLAFLPEEILPGLVYSEGSVHRISVNAYERNPEARRACLDYYGEACVVCGFRFGDAFTGGAKVGLHVHHLIPLHEIGETYTVDPIRDLRPLCPNCHAMAHSRIPPYSPEELTSLRKSAVVEAHGT